jgi:cardiolipin synthase (CMP-forming)
MLNTIPNLLTLLRIILVPFIAYALWYRLWIIALSLFAIAAASDILDGYLARMWNQQTKIGAYLDPLADKLLITACYAVLVFAPVEGLHIPGWFLSIVLVKELALLAGALYWGILKQEIEVRPSLLGKSAMAVQSLLVGWVIACSIFHWMPLKTFHIVLIAALMLIIGSLIQYSYTLYQETHYE